MARDSAVGGARGGRNPQIDGIGPHFLRGLHHTRCTGQVCLFAQLAVLSCCFAIGAYR